MEAATSRLEDLTEFQADALRGISKPSTSDSSSSYTPAHSGTTTTTAPAAAAAAAAPATPAAPVPPAAPAAPAAPEPEALPASVKDFDDFLKEFLQPYLTASKAIGSFVEEQSKKLEEAFKVERDFLLIVSKAKKPSQDDPKLQELWAGISKPLQAAVTIKEENRSSPQSNHLSTIAEGVPALTWIYVDLPVSYIGDFKDGAQFYANRVLKEFKDVDKIHVEWVQSFQKLLTGLQAYVKKHHTTGPSWNPKGEPLANVLAASKTSAASAPAPPAAPAPAAGGPPPPPPPPPPADIFDDVKTEQKPAGREAVFQEINQGASVTSRLKKVDKSQMTHKNPELRKNAPLASSHTKPIPPKKPGSLSSPKKNPPKKELQDSKWIIENFENEHNLVVEAEINQAIFIDRCNNCTIQIKGKANAITINGCNSIGVVAESLVSSVDIIKCKKLGFQVTGKIPTISIDQSDSCQIYLSKDSLDIEIYTSQTTSLNVNIPKEDEEFKETPVPEQLVHRISGGKLVSSIVEHAG